MTSDPTGPATLLAAARHRAATAAMLARAFQDDAATAFIFPDPVQRARRLPGLFAPLFDSDGRAGMRLVTGDGSAASFWRGPGSQRAGTLEMWRHALPMVKVFGGALGRALMLSDAVAAHMPVGDFWYLHIVGCEPAAHGRGHGTAAVRAGLSRVAGRLPCYLETARSANIAFYARMGFSVTDEWCVPRGGPRFWSMTRPPD